MASLSQVLQKILENLPTNANPKIRAAKHREVENIITEYATNIILIPNIQSGNTFTDSRMANRFVGEVSINGNTKNGGFDKVQASSTLTFNDGTTMDNFDIVTVKLL